MGCVNCCICIYCNRLDLGIRHNKSKCCFDTFCGVDVSLCKFVCVYVRTRGQLWLLFLRSYSFILYFEIGELTETCSLLSRLWTPGSICLQCPVSPQSLHVFISSVLGLHHTRVFTWSMGSNTGSPAWVASNLANSLSLQLDFDMVWWIFNRNNQEFV